MVLTCGVDGVSYVRLQAFLFLCACLLARICTECYVFGCFVCCVYLQASAPQCDVVGGFAVLLLMSRDRFSVLVHSFCCITSMLQCLSAFAMFASFLWTMLALLLAVSLHLQDIVRLVYYSPTRYSKA